MNGNAGILLIFLADVLLSFLAGKKNCDYIWSVGIFFTESTTLPSCVLRKKRQNTENESESFELKETLSCVESQ